MARKPKSDAPPEWAVNTPSGLISQTRRYELITPLFGGGTETNVNDAVTPVRGSAIRGQLRFWWRALRGGSSAGDLRTMKQHEDAIWGSPSVPSAVAVVVKAVQRGEPFVVTNSRDYSYVAFPLREDNEVRSGVTFTLELTFPEELADDVAAALWGWETFGGLGARTRRGFGALHCTQVDAQPVALPLADEIADTIRAQLQTHVAGQGAWPAHVAHLEANARLYVSGLQSDPLKAWVKMIRGLQSFRQYKQQGDPYGPNLWPEATAIRQLFRDQQLGATEKFPRSALGLPINFELKHNRDRDLEGVLLKGQDDRGRVQERHASPVIIRPLACRVGAVGIAIQLQGTTPSANLRLEGRRHGRSRSFDVAGTLSTDEANSIPPTADNHAADSEITDVIAAFFRYLEEHN